MSTPSSDAYAHVAQQIQGQSELADARPAAPDALAQQVYDGGAQPASVSDVDVQALLRQVQALQARLDEQDKAAADSQKPEVSRIADLIAAHVKHRAEALGTGSALEGAVSVAEDLAEAAGAFVTGGGPVAAVETLASKLLRELDRHAGKTASADTSYVRDLAAYDLPDAVDEAKQNQQAPPASYNQPQTPDVAAANPDPARPADVTMQGSMQARPAAGGSPRFLPPPA